MRVFVQVHNPTSQNLKLRSLEYRLVADDWFDSRGKVSVERVVLAGASAVVEIRVPISEDADQSSIRGVPYTLDARLFATADKTERSWKLHAAGALANGRNGPMVRTRIAGTR